MTQTHISVFDRTTRISHEWLEDLQSEAPGLRDEEQALSVLRAVLQTLRDRLTVEEAADLGAQLPILIRGFYYERWKPSDTPRRQRTLQAFLDSIPPLLNPAVTIDPASAARAVFAVLDRRISRGEIEDVRSALPKELAALWPER